jgi:hypothetical protein
MDIGPFLEGDPTGSCSSMVNDGNPILSTAARLTSCYARMTSKSRYNDRHSFRNGLVSTSILLP